MLCQDSDLRLDLKFAIPVCPKVDFFFCEMVLGKEFEECNVYDVYPASFDKYHVSCKHWNKSNP